MPGKFHGLRSLLGYSPCFSKELDTTEQLHFLSFQAMVEVMKIMATSFKRPHVYTATFSAPDPAAGHRRPTPLLETPGHSWASLGQSCGVTALFFWVLVHKVLFVPPRGCFPSPASVLAALWWVNGDLRQEGLCCTTPPLHPAPLPLWPATADPYLHRRRSHTVLPQSLWGPWVLVHTRFVRAL